MSDRRRRRARSDRHRSDDRPPAADGGATADGIFPAGTDDGYEAAADARAEAGAFAEFERTRDALLRARRDERPARKAAQTRDERPGRIPVRGETRASSPRPEPAPAREPGGSSPRSGAAAPALTTASYSLFTPRTRAVRRDGPMAWAGRRYRRFRRGLRENITAYGHRYNSVGGDATEGRPLLLWLVDAPRLFAMYFDHAEYRLTRGVTLLFRDLRSRPPRIEWDKQSVHSPLVGFTVPTVADLNPVWRWPAVVAFWATFREDWRAALAETFGGLAAIYRNARAEIAAELDALLSRFGGVLGWAQANLTRFDRLFRGSDEGAWVFACGTGLAGLALTSLLFWNVDAAVAAATANRETAGPSAAAHRGPGVGGWNDDFGGDPGDPDDFGEDLGDPTAVGGPADFGDDFGGDFGGEPEPRDVVFRPDPDPLPVVRATPGGFGAPDVPVARGTSDGFGPADGPVARGTSADPLPDPFGDGPAADDWGLPVPADPVPRGPELAVKLERRELPEEIVGYAPPDDDRPVTVTAAPAARRPLPDDPGGWGYADVRVDRRPAAGPPPALRGAGPAGAVSLAPLAAEGEDDGVTPVASGLGLSVRRSPAADAGDGRLGYELRVTNDGPEPAAAAVEETVGAGVTVVAAEPAAAFTADPAGGGTLRWDLSDLPPGATRRLTVAVVPDPGADELLTAGRVVGAVRVASATSVEEPPAEPPADAPPAYEPAPFDPAPFGPARDAFDSDPIPADPPSDDFGGGDLGGDFGDDDFGDFGSDPDGAAGPTPDGEPAEDEPAFEEGSPFGGEPTFEEEPPFGGEPAFGGEPDFGGDADDFPAPPTTPPAPLPDAAVRPAQVLTPRPEEPADPPAGPTATGDADRGPRLRVTLAGPPSAAAGGDVRLIVTVANEGAAAAEAVTVTCPMPAGLRHPRGSVVRCVLGEIAPGETRTATLIARVTAAGGSVTPTAEVTARGGLSAELAAPVRVGGETPRVSMR